ncbi:MAG: 6-bladed beta-propeller [Bacteroidales bacterium]|nr:6-bladed beta-propeller [Bacteroidales bacterium]
MPQIVWVKTWPGGNKSRQHSSLKERINSVVFGIKNAVLSTPVAVLANSPDDFLVLDQGNEAMFHVEEEMGQIPQPFLKKDHDLTSLVGFCQGPGQTILITNSKTGKILIYNKKESRLHILNDTLSLDQPTGIAYSAELREIWILETKSHCISILDEEGKLKRKIGERGTGKGQFNYPTHIWIDKSQKVYVSDAMNFRIQVLNSAGEVISSFGETGDATGYLARPKGVATDSYGNIYIVDALFHAVQVFDLHGTFLYSFGIQGHQDNEFWLPSGIYIDDNNFIYIADTYNSRVQVFQLTNTTLK